MKRIFITVAVFFCMMVVSTDIAHAEEEGKKRRGLLGGLLEQVGSTVEETVKAVGGIVESTVDGVGKTVDDTVSFTKDTVETLVDPEEKKPVSKIVDNTVKHLGKTVENVEPVLKQTTKTVDTVTTEVVGVTEELPDLPVVKPVVKEVGKVVNQTSKTVTQTVDKTVDTTVETVNGLPAVVEEVTKPVSQLPEVIEEITKPVKPEQKPEKPEVAEPEKPQKTETQPVEENRPVQMKKPKSSESVNQHDDSVDAKDDAALQEVDTAVSEPVIQTKPESAESDADIKTQPVDEKVSFEEETTPFAEEAIAEIPNERQAQTKTVIALTEPAAASAKSAEPEAVAKPFAPPVPLNTKTSWQDNPVTMTTATTSISTTSVVNSGLADFVTGIVNWLDGQLLLEGRQWIHMSEIMRNQWTHAPPVQPPQQTPFLHINNQN